MNESGEEKKPNTTRVETLVAVVLVAALGFGSGVVLLAMRCYVGLAVVGVAALGAIGIFLLGSWGKEA